MLVDALNMFVAPGAPLSLVAGVGIAVPTNPLDILGVGAGQAPPGIIGTTTLFGSDMGVGAMNLELVVQIGTALASGNAATLNGQFQAAPDTGSAGGYQPGTWQTLEEQGPITVAQGAANTRIMRFKFPPVFPATLRPRFYRINFAVPAATNFTAGTIASAFLTTVRTDPSMIQAARNYTVQ